MTFAIYRNTTPRTTTGGGTIWENISDTTIESQINTTLVSSSSDENALVFGASTTETSVPSEPSERQRLLFIANSQTPDAGAFRAGVVSGEAWNQANRGRASVAFGEDTQASGEQSAALGGYANVVSSTRSAVVGGQYNFVESSSMDNNNIQSSSSVVIGGESNVVRGSDRSMIGGGSGNLIDTGSNQSAILAGQGNTVASSAFRAAIVAGESGTVGGMNTVIISGNHCTVMGGASVVVSGDHSVVSGARCVSAGRMANSSGDHNFVWGDAGESGERSTSCSNTKRFVIGSTGGIQLGGETTSETIYPVIYMQPALGSVAMQSQCAGYLLMYLNDGANDVKPIMVPYFDMPTIELPPAS